MSSKELIENYPEEFKKIGVIFYNFNFVEIQLITILSMFFSNRLKNDDERDYIFNDALFDKDVFPTFENKISLLYKIISTISRVAVEKNKKFDQKGYLEIYKKIKDQQKIRNILAHNYFGFRVDGKGVGFRKRKSDKERIHEYKIGVKAPSQKEILVDLDQELKKSDEICQTFPKLFGILKDARDMGIF